MRGAEFEAGINAIVGVTVALLVRWAGESLGFPTALTFILMIFIAGGCGWLLGSLRRKRDIHEV